ncbi:hypothetical protein OB905_09270 [Halobacteria archaeon AArc-dxtr1]|nr:hypothetical protein [Halobacteria archaeon AArc-dxtr1]
MSLDPDQLEERLRAEFGGSRGASRVVARQARTLADAGRYERDTGVELTSAIVIEELADAPDGAPPERWNWWLGALEIAYGGYEEFSVRRYRR